MDAYLEDMYEQFSRGWDAGVDAIVPASKGGVAVRYQGLLYADEPARDKFWCRVSTVNFGSEQTTLSATPATYTTTGMIFVQVFGPRQLPGAWDICQSLARLAQSAFRDYQANGNVWYSEVSVQNLAPEDNWLRFNTSARFTYDEIY